MLGHNVGDYAKVNVVDGRPAAMHSPGVLPTGSYNGSGWKGHNLHWLKAQRPELFKAKKPEDVGAAMEQGPPAAPGFKDFNDGWFRNPQTEEFLEKETGRRFAKDKDSGMYHCVREGISLERELSVLGEASTSCGTAGASKCRKLSIADLHRVAAVLKQDISHHDRPAAVFAVFLDVSGPGTVVEVAAKGLHSQLLPRLAGYRGEWSPEDMKSALVASLSNSLAMGKAAAGESVSAAAALLLGSRLAVAVSGPGARCVVCARQAKMPGSSILAVRSGHVSGDICRAAEGATEELATLGNPPAKQPFCLAPPRHIGSAAASDRAPGDDAQGIMTAHFDLEHGGRFEGLALMAHPATLLPTLPDNVIAPVVERMAGQHRPRAGCRSLIQAAKAHDTEGSLAVAMVNFMWASSLDAAAAPLAKRARLLPSEKAATPSDKVRVRHILLRHTSSSSSAPAQDSMRGRKVTRSPEEAEDQLLVVLADLDRDPGQFTAKCREISECQSALKGGELAGDLGWLSRDKPRSSMLEVHKAAFSLAVGQISDLVESSSGIHVLMRTA
mmetsp:Transcript_17515/g.48008  ORF Transcript_17515/g.48008 Transcript_17515/m.48008 type:complete len:556 (+) Transcript_17515:137-1804(+)